MKTTTSCIAFGIIAAVAGHASAGVYSATDPGIFSPYDNAQVDFVWVNSDAGYTGELQWVDTAFEAAPSTMWTNKNATSGQSFRVSRLFDAGERVDFRYEIIKGGIDAFASDQQADWYQFNVDATNPYDVLVGIEDIRYPSGDMDHNDAVFRVVFSQATVPSPGSIALIGAGGLFMVRRRR